MILSDEVIDHICEECILGPAPDIKFLRDKLSSLELEIGLEDGSPVRLKLVRKRRIKKDDV